MKEDVKELGELVIFVGKAGSVINAIMADGKVGITDIPKLLGLVPYFPSAFTGMEKIPAELSDLDAQEALYLVDLFISEFKLSSKESEDKINEILKGLIELYKFFGGLKGL